MYKLSPESILRLALEGFEIAFITNSKEEAIKELKLRISKFLEVPVKTLFNEHN